MKSLLIIMLIAMAVTSCTSPLMNEQRISLLEARVLHSEQLLEQQRQINALLFNDVQISAEERAYLDAEIKKLNDFKNKSFL